MKKNFFLLFLFFAILLIYFAYNTNFTFIHITQGDYFNPMAQAILSGHLDVPKLARWEDTIEYKSKIYLPWGILTPLVFAMLERLTTLPVFPIFLVHLGFASLNVLIVYLLLKRVQREFFSHMTNWELFTVLALYAFGTNNLYVGTLDQVWFTDQIISSTLGILGTYVIFKRKRTTKDYIVSTSIFCLALLGRATVSLLVVIPFILYISECLSIIHNRLQIHTQLFVKGLFIFAIPFSLGLAGYFSYNYARFGNILEFGFRYIKDDPIIAQFRIQNGVFSLSNIPRNAWYMLWEIPRISLSNNKLDIGFNSMGNSIFFLSPPLLAIFLANPFSKKRRLTVNFHVLSLWVGSILATLPNIMFYGSGWFQFGYRFSQDTTHLLVLLSIFGMKGKLNILYVGGTLIAIILYTTGVGLLHAG